MRLRKTTRYISTRNSEVLPAPKGGLFAADRQKRQPIGLNSFGHMFRFTTWGESHGIALRAVVDGCASRRYRYRAYPELDVRA